MTRKDYILIAAALKEAREAIKEKEPDGTAEFEALLDGVAYVAAYLSDALGRANPCFDRERFLRAAGVQS